ncbi:MAG: pseudaminic acid cytidylyltransferase [Pontibacter sp.]|nr:pseudaminic acid cytidylyltransferase [Pontibacter sp.]
MKTIAIIPARGGSKRIPRKNIKPFLGKPIIAYTIEAAINSGLFTEVMVSTDDAEIAEVSRAYGASVPFLRSEDNAGDFATTAAVIQEVLDQYEQQGNSFDLGCCLYPTAPFVSLETLKESQHLLLEKEYDTVFPVVKYSYPIWRSLKVEEGRASMIWPENLTKRSQDLPPAFHDAGQFYWFRVESFKQNQSLFTDNSGAYELDELYVQDIDSLTDWKLAELKYKLLHHLD